MQDHSLDRLFCPAAIAVIGASRSPGKAGYQMLQAVSQCDGAVYPINPGAEEILGLPAYPSLAATPGPVDLAVITLPAKLCLEAVSSCAEHGVGAVMIISGGFSEAGAEGEALQARIVATCKAAGMRLLGPNTSGFANPSQNLIANFAPGMDNIDSGPVGLVSQSGAVTLALSSLAADQGIGASLAVGTGNGRDVSPADVIAYLGERDDTAVIVVYLEGVSDGAALCAAIRGAVANKPVVVMSVGRADIGAFAASHTGNLIGSYKLKRAALAQAGAVFVDSLEDLIDAARLFSKLRLPPQQNPGVALLTGQAGPAMIISDHLKANAVSMPPLQEASVARIRELLPPMTFIRNPIDTGRPGASFGDVLDIVCQDDAVDLTLAFALHEPSAIDPVAVLARVENDRSKPILFGTAGALADVEPTLRRLADMNVPAFATPDRLARAVRALVDDAKAQHRLGTATPAVAPVGAPSTTGVGLTEAEAKRLIAAHGIAVPESRECASHQDALAAFEALRKPLAVKILGPGILHKTEIGGVHLHVRTPEALRRALSAIDAIHPAGRTRYLIEEMAPPGLELILGGKRDASFGPTVLVGLGGVYAEALDDVAVRIAPLTRRDADDMLSTLRGAALLDGWRGAPPIEKDGLIDAIMAMSCILLEQTQITEIDINPLRVYPEGLMALDAVVIQHGTAGKQGRFLDGQGKP